MFWVPEASMGWLDVVITPLLHWACWRNLIFWALFWGWMYSPIYNNNQRKTCSGRSVAVQSRIRPPFDGMTCQDMTSLGFNLLFWDVQIWLYLPGLRLLMQDLPDLFKPSADYSWEMTCEQSLLLSIPLLDICTCASVREVLQGRKQVSIGYLTRKQMNSRKALHLCHWGFHSIGMPSSLHEMRSSTKAATTSG